MPTILDLFNSQKKELYNTELIRIDSRGLINPPRGAALLASSPSSLADLVGGQLAGAINGVANRPSDTIFKKGNPLAKPITLTAFTQASLRDIVESNTNYVIKQNPSIPSVIQQISQGGSSPRGVATNLAIQGINKFGSKSSFNQLKKDLKNKPKLKTNGSFGAKLYTNEESFSTELKKQAQAYRYWDKSNEELNDKLSFEDNSELQEWIDDNRFQNQVPITFQKYGKSTIIPFVGAITGISEDITPEWGNFRYVGNPFKTYRYQGVERSIKFNLKLYYMGIKSKQSMIKKIEYLKSLAFPDETISEIKYGDSQTSQYAFSPNLLTFSIGDLYKNMFGYIESLSFSIDDNVIWSNFNPTNLSNGDNSLYPSVMDVSIGIKIIENHSIKDSKYGYNFNGTKVFDKKQLEVLKENEELQQQADIFEAEIQKINLESDKKIKEEKVAESQLKNFIESIRPNYI